MVPLDHESLQLMLETAVKASGHEVSKRVFVTSHPDPRKAILIDKDGNHSILDRCDPPRNHKLLSCQEVVSYSRLMNHEKAIVWIGSCGIIVTHDAARVLGHKADYRFQRTAEFKFVQEKLASETYSQKEFLALLRVKLARSFERDELRQQLIKSVRSIRSVTDQRSGQGTGSFEAGLLSTANEKIEWPESFMLSLSVFDDSAIDAPQLVECVLDVDPSSTNKPFAVTPIVADIAKAIDTVVALAGEVIRTELANDKVPVLLGEPVAG